MGNKYSLHADKTEEVIPVLVKKECAWCHHPLSRRPIYHRNQSHSPPIIPFCSRDCHNAWCYAESQK